MEKLTIKCPKCGHDTINVPIWGSGEVSTGGSLEHPEPVSVNVDLKDGPVFCTECNHEGDIDDFKTN